MQVIVKCDACGKRLRAPEQSYGKRIKCPCGTRIPVPAVELAEAAPAPPDLTDALESLQHGESLHHACPECGSAMAANAVLCTHCGYNVKSGKRLAAAVATPGMPAAKSAPEAAAKGAPRGNPVARSHRGPEGGPTLTRFLKPLILLAALGGGGYWIYSLFSFDPVAQGRDRIGKLTPGMTLKQVVDAMGRPQEAWRYITFEEASKDRLLIAGRPTRADYSLDMVKNYKGRLSPGGFYLVYRFTAGSAHHVNFDPNGVMISTEQAENIFDP